MLLDNFYQNPDEVRELALKGRRESHKSAFGRTAFMPTWEFAAKTKHIFDGICFDENLWFNENRYKYMKNLGKCRVHGSVY